MTDAMIQIAQEVDTRRYGKYRGFVVDNKDDEQRGRLKVRVPSTLGSEVTDWALPCVPFGGADGTGLLLLPEIGAEVWVEFEEGDLSRPIWVGAFWSKAPQKGGPDLGSPTARTLRTPSGQILRFDDEKDKTGITVHHSSGSEIKVVDDGTVTITDGHGQTITLKPKDKKILVEDGNGNRIQTSSSGLTLDNGKARIEMSGPEIVLKATSIKLDGKLISLGSGSEPVIKGTSFLSAYMAHTHPTSVSGAPTAPPIPTSESTSLSTAVKTG